MTSDLRVPGYECPDRETIAREQGRRLELLLAEIHGCNRFYTRKLDDARIDIRSLRLPEDLTKLPLTAKSEFVEDQVLHPPWGTALTEPIEHYTRYCQTSSTTGSPLRWLDTNKSWQWGIDCWKAVYHAARIGPGDRLFFPFSFGPFMGFWSAFEAGCQLGAHCIPGGGMSSHQRLALIESLGTTVVCTTPTYALRLAEIAAGEGKARELAGGSVRALIVAGEPGGSIPETRERIQRSWGARVIDHHGLTETGPMSFECWENPGGLHVNEREFICEVLDPVTHEPVADGLAGELVATNLGRTASPVVRYLTGDIVARRRGTCRCGRTWARLEGGIQGRVDDMINIRGVNVYPAAIESIVRRFPEIIEFRATVSRHGAVGTLSLEIEPAPETADSTGTVSQLSHQLRDALLGLHVPVQLVAPGALPRFEMKSRRFVVQPSEDGS